MAQHSSFLQLLPGARSFTSILALVATGACSASPDHTAIEAAGVGEAASPTASQAPEATPVEPSASPSAEPSMDELMALADSPELFFAGFPFAESPSADATVWIRMSDDVRLAASLFFPAGARSEGDLPSVYVDEWYGRDDEAIGTAIELYRQAGFVVALVDGRGYGASFGAQESFMTARARDDQREVISWLTAQPWSNGTVSAVGLSLSGSLAGVMTGSGAPALRAAVIRSADYDQYTTNMYPGGVPNGNMQEAIAGFSQKMRGVDCAEDVAACAPLGVAPGPDDADLSELQAAFGEHATNVDGAALAQAIYRDDQLGEGTWFDMTPAEHASVRVPARVWSSWVDGLTADSALLRFASHPNTPMEVVIGANTHMGGLDGDPFLTTPFPIARPAPQEAFAGDVAFVERVLGGEPIGRSVTYLVLGTDSWLTTSEWPPPGTERHTWALSGGQLVAGEAEPGERSYHVDPSATSGPFNRWASQRSTPIHYGDRRAAPGQRLSFDAPPVDVDTLLVGSAELCLAMTTDQTDGLVVAYLEDVAPDGRVTYLSEGELRLLHRATASGDCDPAPGTERSFARADARPVTVGEPMRIELSFATTAALVRQGHRVRLSLAGADAGTFPLLSEEPANWVVRFGGAEGSTLTLPVQAWSAANGR